MMPTTIQRAIQAEGWAGAGAVDAKNQFISDLKNGISKEFYHSFNPTLFIALQGVSPAASAINIPVRFDLEYDIVVRGLRRVGGAQ